MPSRDRLMFLLLHITPTTVRSALFVLNLAVLGLGFGLRMPANERWE
jgi:hypothetical protein